MIEQTNQIPAYVETLISYSNALAGLPAIPLIFVGCIVAGYAAKQMPFIPNKWISGIVIFLAIVANVCVLPSFSWLLAVRAVMYGLITGVIAIVVYKRFLKKYEDDEEPPQVKVKPSSDE